MAAQYPDNLWDANVQDIGNDVGGDDTIANAADYNEMADEVVAIEDDLRLALTGWFGTPIAHSIEELLNQLRPSVGAAQYAPGAFGVTGTYTILTGGVDSGSTGGTFVTFGANKLTIGADGAGDYVVEAVLGWAAPANTYELEPTIMKNSAVQITHSALTTGETSGEHYQSVILGGVVTLAVADTVEIQVKGDVDTVTFNDAYLRIRRVGV